MITMTDRQRRFLDLKGEDPFRYYRYCLASGKQVFWDDSMRAWMALTHAACSKVQRDEELFAHPYWDLPGAVEVQGGARQVMMLHGADHTRLHRFLMRYFSPTVVENYRSRYIAPLVTRMLQRLCPAKHGDLDLDLADYLPAYVICSVLGISIEDEELLVKCKNWNDDIMRWSETFGEDAGVLSDALDSARYLAEVLLPIIINRKFHPRGDFLSTLWREGPGLLAAWTEYDVLAQARVLLFAGSETTAHLIRNALYHLICDPDLQRWLAAHPRHIGDFVEEVLRYYGAIHFRIRSMTTDLELAGCPMRTGDRVLPVLSAANRDPARFERPDLFNLNRTNSRNHLAFGLGPRMCVGANLARAEVIEVVGQVLSTLRGLTWDGEQDHSVHLVGHMARSYRPLPARWAVGP